MYADRTVQPFGRGRLAWVALLVALGLLALLALPTAAPAQQGLMTGFSDPFHYQANSASDRAAWGRARTNPSAPTTFPIDGPVRDAEARGLQVPPVRLTAHPFPLRQRTESSYPRRPRWPLAGRPLPNAGRLQLGCRQRHRPLWGSARRPISPRYLWADPAGLPRALLAAAALRASGGEQDSGEEQEEEGEEAKKRRYVTSVTYERTRAVPARRGSTSSPTTRSTTPAAGRSSPAPAPTTSPHPISAGS